MKLKKLYRFFLPLVILFGMIILFTPGYERAVPVPQAERPITWAQSLPDSKVGNFYKVTDGVYRGDRPTPDDLKDLQSRGIKTLLDLEFFYTDRYTITESKTSFKFLHVRMNPWHIEDEDIVEALNILTDKNNYPIYVHCKHGSDRTGVVIAMYRIVVQGWSKEDAIAEMRGGGYGFHLIWGNIPEYIKNVDIEKIKSSMLPGNV